MTGMDLGSLLFILALAVLVGIFVTQPFLKISKKERLLAPAATVMDQDQEKSVLLAERDRLLTSLQDLEFDFSLGKIPAEEYPVQRSELLQAGASILKRLDDLEPEKVEDLSAEDRVEAAVAARRANSQKQLNVLIEKDALDAAINNRRRSKQEKPAGFCPKCGNAVQKSDVFCSHCGATLS